MGYGSLHITPGGIQMLRMTALAASLLTVFATSHAVAGIEAERIEASMHGSGIEIHAPAAASGYQLLLRDPDGRLSEHAFHGNEPILLRAAGRGGWADGTYVFEIRPVHSARARGELPAGGDGDPSPALAWSGSFGILDGLMLDPLAREDQLDTAPAATGGRAPSRSTGTGIPAGELVLPMETFPTNVQVQGSLCVGFDCLSNESYGFDTVRLKENNTRLVFRDTSTAPGFPAVSWQLVANDSASGGRDYMAIQNMDTGRFPFMVMHDAPTNALYVAPNGFVGLGTATPAQALSVLRANTPALRLEQTAGEFAAQAWDLAANEAGLFVRDASGGDLVPLRVQAGTPSNTLSVGAGGVAIGAAQAQARLQVRDTGSDAQGQQLRMEATQRNRLVFGTPQGAEHWHIDVENSLDNQGGIAFKRVSQGRVRGTLPAPTVMRLDGAGNLNLAGTLTQNSDRHSKRPGETVDASQILERVRELPISRWSFLADQPGVEHIGPMAQDFHAAFGLGDSEQRIAPLDTSGVALAAIQGLARELDARDARIAELERDLARLAGIVERLAGEQD